MTDNAKEKCCSHKREQGHIKDFFKRNYERDKAINDEKSSVIDSIDNVLLKSKVKDLLDLLESIRDEVNMTSDYKDTVMFLRELLEEHPLLKIENYK